MIFGRIAFRGADVVSIGYNNRWDGMREITLKNGKIVMVREYGVYSIDRRLHCIRRSMFLGF